MCYQQVSVRRQRVRRYRRLLSEIIRRRALSATEKFGNFTVAGGTHVAGPFQHYFHGNITDGGYVDAHSSTLTLVGAAVFLSESITVPRVAGTILVVAGVVLISR